MTSPPEATLCGLTSGCCGRPCSRSSEFGADAAARRSAESLDGTGDSVGETTSEMECRQFCQQARWFAWKGRTQDARQEHMPDFVVWRWLRRSAVEVKQVDPTAHDLEQQRRLDAGGIAPFGGEPGGRLRGHLKSGSAQLRSLTKGRWPGMIVLFDNTAL